MKCINCAKEVFYISTQSGEPIFYCVDCGVPHFPEPAEVGVQKAAKSLSSDRVAGGGAEVNVKNSPAEMPRLYHIGDQT
jgi:hypothetical protein